MNKDIFCFNYGCNYKLVMVGGYELSGIVTQVYENGLELDNYLKIAQSHIMFFHEIKS